MGGDSNPERSKNTRSGSKDNIIAIDASGLKGGTKVYNVDDEKSSVVKWGAFVIAYGSGHNSGLDEAFQTTVGTYNTSEIMYGGTDLVRYFESPNHTTKTIIESPNNDYKKSVKKRFGNNVPSEKNKQSIDVKKKE